MLTCNDLSDKLLTKDEMDGIYELANLTCGAEEKFSNITSEIQYFEGIIGGIAADNVVSIEEIKLLIDWIDNNYHLKGSFPFDEIESISIQYMKDGKIDDQESSNLLNYFSQFNKIMNKLSIDSKMLNINGICVVNPDIIFENKLFCFTGVSVKGKRRDIEKLINDRGGLYNDNITSETDYLIIGVNGNPCWAYSCYGKKVEKAINNRKDGLKILIINEHDFWDSFN